MCFFTDPTVGIAHPVMQRAVLLAERGRGTVSPNPLVGCVIVRGDEVVGEGFHERPGRPHAEAMALEAAGDRARGAHAFVTLEPCNHYGRTPPCATRLIAAGVAEVTIGMPDPNPEVAGGGAAALEAAGVIVHWADDPSPFARQNEAWLFRMRTGRPFVTVKVALTLDGRPTLATGSRTRITGAGAAGVTMALRARATAVAVGRATAVIDDPVLTVRHPDGTLADGHQPRRVLLCRDTLPPLDLRMMSDAFAAPLVVVSDLAPSSEVAGFARRGVPVVRYLAESGLTAALRALAHEGIDDVFVETGPGLLSALWREALIDELVTFTAGGMGGDQAPCAFSGSADVNDGGLAARFLPVWSSIEGEDLVAVWRPKNQNSPDCDEGSVA